MASNSELFKDIIMILGTTSFPPKSNEFILVRRDGREAVPVNITILFSSQICKTYFSHFSGKGSVTFFGLWFMLYISSIKPSELLFLRLIHRFFNDWQSVSAEHMTWCLWLTCNWKSQLEQVVKSNVKNWLHLSVSQPMTIPMSQREKQQEPSCRRRNGTSWHRKVLQSSRSNQKAWSVK